MKARGLLLAAIHPRLPIEGEMPSLGGATEWLDSQSRWFEIEFFDQQRDGFVRRCGHFHPTLSRARISAQAIRPGSRKP